MGAAGTGAAALLLAGCEDAQLTTRTITLLEHGQHWMKQEIKNNPGSDESKELLRSLARDVRSKYNELLSKITLPEGDRQIGRYETDVALNINRKVHRDIPYRTTGYVLDVARKASRLTRATNLSIGRGHARTKSQSLIVFENHLNIEDVDPTISHVLSNAKSEGLDKQPSAEELIIGEYAGLEEVSLFIDSIEPERRSQVYTTLLEVLSALDLFIASLEQNAPVEQNTSVQQ